MPVGEKGSIPLLSPQVNAYSVLRCQWLESEAAFRWLARDYERLPDTLAGLHYIAFACLMLSHLTDALDIVHNMLLGVRQPE